MAKKIDDLLADTLQEMTRKKSLDSITVTELVTAAGVNRKTFYNHFDGIEGLLRHIILDRHNQITNERTSIEVWDNNIRKGLPCLKKNAGFTHKVFQSRYLQDLKDWLRPEMDRSVQDFIILELELLEKNTGKTYPLSEGQMAKLISLYSPCVFAMIEEWFMTGMKLSIDDFINLIVRVLAGGVYACVTFFQEQETITPEKSNS